MPEYIPKANYPEGLASKVLELQSQQVNPTETLVKSLGDLGSTYFSAKKEKKEKEAAREQKVADVDEAQISDLIEKGYLELDPNILKNLKPGESKRAAIKRWIPEEERKANSGGGGTKYNINADEMQMASLEALRNAYDKSKNPEAPDYKIDRKNPPKIASVEGEINRIKSALIAEGKSLESLLAAIPDKATREAVKAAGVKAEGILGATTVKPKEPKKEAPKAESVKPEVIAAIEKTKGIKTPTGNLHDSIKASAGEKKSGAINAIMKQTGVGAVEAEEIYNAIRK